MKQFKKILSVLIASTLIVVACDTDPEGTFYNAGNDEVFFTGTSAKYDFGADDPDAFEIEVKRGNAVGAVTVAVTITDASGFFNVPDVKFEEGSYTAKVKVAFDRNDLTVGKPYTIVLVLKDHPISGGNHPTEFTLGVTRDYVWQAYASGTLQSGMFGPLEREMQKAEGAERYKMVSLIVNGYDFIFDADENGVMTPVGLSQNSAGYYIWYFGYNDPQYGAMQWYFDAASGLSFFDRNAGIVSFDVAYVVSAGSFGWFTETFTIE